MGRRLSPQLLMISIKMYVLTIVTAQLEDRLAEPGHNCFTDNAADMFTARERY